MTKFRNNITLGFLLIITLTSNCQEAITDSTILNADSSMIDGRKYKAIYKTDEFFYIIDSQDKIVFKRKDYYKFYEFSDFDNDGNNDILFSYLGNVPRMDLILYDKKSKNFKAVENFRDYPEPTKIADTKYYYSYHRSGCADRNWDSDLFFIEDFKTYKLGTISGRECEGSAEKEGLYIFIIKENKETLLETKDINEIHKFQNDKWDFINDYWIKNYKRFE